MTFIKVTKNFGDCILVRKESIKTIEDDFGLKRIITFNDGETLEVEEDLDELMELLINKWGLLQVLIFFRIKNTSSYRTNRPFREEVRPMVKGYFIHSGYMGWVELYQTYMLFASESDYYEYLSDDLED